MTKKVSYIQLLKEAISEYDASVLDYKGPLLDPIISYKGEGDIETQKDASSILERYYFKEKQEGLIEQEEDIGPDKPVEASEDEDAEDPNEIITGEEADSIEDTMDDFENEILDEILALEDYDVSDDDIVAKDKPLDVEDVKKDTEDPDTAADNKPLDVENIDEDTSVDEGVIGAVGGGAIGRMIAKNPKIAKKIGKINPNAATAAGAAAGHLAQKYGERSLKKESELLEDIVIEKLIQEMESESDVGPENEIKKPKDEETQEAGTGMADEEEIKKELEEMFDILEDEDVDSEEKKEDEGEKEDGEKEAEDKVDELDVDKEIKREQKALSPMHAKAAREIEEAFKLFEQEIKDDEDEEKKDEEKKDEDEDKELEEMFDILEDEDVDSEEKKEDEGEKEDGEKEAEDKDEE